MIEVPYIDSESPRDFGMSKDAGCLELSDQQFRGIHFQRVSVGPGHPPDRIFRLRRCVFAKCNVAPGPLAFRAGVELSQVEFDSVESGDSLTISTSAVLDRVIVKGVVRKGGLWVRPDEVLDAEKARTRQEWAARRSIDIEWHLDISELDCPNIEVIGLPTNKLRYDTERHIAICADWRDQAQSVSLARFGFIANALRRLRTFGAHAGVFALPASGSERLLEFRREMELLRRLGVDA